MHDSARACSLLARPKSGIAPRLPQVPRSTSSLASDPLLPPTARFTTHRSLLTASGNVNRYSKLLEFELTYTKQTRKDFLIATICPTFFSPAPLPALLIGTGSRLEIDLTRSEQTRKHFLIGTIRPTFTSAPLLTHHLSLLTRDFLTSFLFATNGIHKILALMKTKEKQLSIRYKFGIRGIALRRLTTPAISNRNTPEFRNAAIPWKQTRNDFLTATNSHASQNSPRLDVHGRSEAHATDGGSHITSSGHQSLLTNHYSPITNHYSLYD